MVPKRGQPPKPPEERREAQMKIRHTEAERALLEKAHQLSGSPRTLARWVASVTVEEAQRIVNEHEK